MDAQVLIGGTDVSSYLLSIDRSKNYCNISQEFTIKLDLGYPNTINAYDDVVIYEEGVKVLTGFISSYSRSAPEAALMIKGQDTYKKAKDYFVPEQYTTDGTKTVKYWIEFFLGEADLSATFTDGEGPNVRKDESFGLQPAANIIEPLLQYAGWYGNVDGNGNLTIGKLDPSLTGIVFSDVDNILDITVNKSAQESRNKVKVFGATEFDFINSEYNTIFSSASRDAPYLVVDQTTVIGNPHIDTQEEADDIANKFVEELYRPRIVIQLSVLGNPNILAGTYAEVLSREYSGKVLITSMSSNFSDTGYTMSLTLNDLCQRLVIHLQNEIDVYAGTDGSGVWKYNLIDESWENISSGLSPTAKYINDLSVSNQLYSAATHDGIYTKLGSSGWTKAPINPITASGFTLGSGSIIYSSVYSNSFNREVNALITYAGAGDEDDYAWFYTGTLLSGSTGFTWDYAPITTQSGLGNPYLGKDLEGNLDTKYIVAAFEGGGLDIPSPVNPFAWNTNRGQNKDASRIAPPSIEFTEHFNQQAEPWQSDWTANTTDFINHLVSDSVYVFTQDDSQELKKFDISDGTELANSNSLTDLSGNSFFMAHDKLYHIGETSPDQDIELYEISKSSLNETLLYSYTNTGNQTAVGFPVIKSGNVYVLIKEDDTSDSSTIMARILKISATGITAIDITSGIQNLGTHDDGPSLSVNTIAVHDNDTIYAVATASDEIIDPTYDFTFTQYVIGINSGGTVSTIATHTYDTNFSVTSGPIYTANGNAYYRKIGTGEFYRNDNFVADSPSDILGTDDTYIYIKDSSTGQIEKYFNSNDVATSSTPISYDDYVIMDESIAFIEDDGGGSATLTVLDKDDLSLSEDYSINHNAGFAIEIFLVSDSWFLIPGNSNLRAIAAYQSDSSPPTPSIGTDILFKTINNTSFTQLETGNFDEVNSDLSVPITIYDNDTGQLQYSSNDYISKTTFSGITNVDDVTTVAYLDKTYVIATTPSGLYRITVSGTIVEKVTTSGYTEIVNRHYGDQETFASNIGNVYQSTNYGNTFINVSAGLPGTLITVLRTDR